MGTVRLASMFSTMRRAPPRMGWAMSPGRMAGTARAFDRVARGGARGRLLCARASARRGAAAGAAPPAPPSPAVQAGPSAAARLGLRRDPEEPVEVLAPARVHRLRGRCGTAPACRGRTRSSPRNRSPGRRRGDRPGLLNGQSIASCVSREPRFPPRLTRVGARHRCKPAAASWCRAPVLGASEPIAAAEPLEHASIRQALTTMI